MKNSRRKLKSALAVARDAVGAGSGDVDPNYLLQQVVNGKIDDFVPPLEARIEAAKVLMPYRHKKKPVDINQTTTAPFIGIDINVPGLPKA